MYQEALSKSGYNYNVSYNEPRSEIQHSRKNRPRNILWYNPPFSKNVKTNVGKCFLSLIDQHIPKSHPLHKIFNRNTLKLSYSCMTNIKTTTKLKSTNLILPMIPMIATVTAATQACAPWTENATTKT